ncbi:MAG TPA: ABC transporter substrate-binding protein, partial [Kofleriaceae bacterium]|nr:ABC transporter substrate-binding protein [Kofleriaceae bacterium]
FLDTRGDPDGAAAAVDQAAAKGALAALGPVGERESLAAAARAVATGLPIALLSPGQAAAPDAGVFRLWPAVDWEAGEAVRVARSLGFDRLAILAPRDEQGTAEVDAFRAAARAGGAEVVAAGQYDPTAGDLEPDLKSFLGLDPRSNRRLARHLARHGVKNGWKTFSPDVDFDLLYIPDEHDRATLVAAYLPYFNVEVRTDENMDVELLERKHGGRVPRLVQLLGSSGWHHPGLGPRGGAIVEWALVIDVFSGGGNDEASSDGAAAFAAAFERHTGHPPGSLAAQAHDAALLLLRARAAAAAAPDARAELRRRLRGARVDDGACSPAQVGADGGLTRAAILLRVDQGELVVEDSPN